MAVEAYERLGRRLREHHEKLHQAVGTRAEGFSVLLFEHWDDERGRLRVLRVRARFWLNLIVTRAIAQAVLGKAWIFGYEVGGQHVVDYVVELDGGALHSPVRPLEITEPTVVRWFDGRGLAAGLGQQDNGFVTFKNKRLLPAAEL